MNRDEASLLDVAQFVRNILSLMEGVDQATLENDREHIIRWRENKGQACG